MNRQNNTLGNLIVALFEEANQVVSQRAERKVLVYAALKHLLRKQVRSTHRIALQASPWGPNRQNTGQASVPVRRKIGYRCSGSSE